jgi:hypothetical protein
MRHLTALGFCFLTIFGCSLAFASDSPDTPADRKPVLVELFTSEGCSSCPPADVVLQKLLAQQPVPGVEIIALEEHVDYWDHDGWIDPYSAPAWTERQQAYSSLRKTDPYTPELVIDGQSQVTGSKVPDVLREIASASRAAKAEIAITPESPTAQGSRRFKIAVTKLEGNSHDTAEVWLAVTEDGLHSDVSRGENHGLLLNHVATLRSLRKIGVADPGKAEPLSADADVKLNSHWNAGNLHVTVFLQRKKSLEIIGVATTKLETPTSASAAFH